MTPLEAGSPQSVHLPDQPYHDFEASATEQLQGYDSFSLPPGLYVPEASVPRGTQMPNQAQHVSPAQLQTQVGMTTPNSLQNLQAITTMLQCRESCGTTQPCRMKQVQRIWHDQRMLGTFCSVCDLSKLWTQGCPVAADDGLAMYGIAKHLETSDSIHFMGADAHYFQTAQMKLHAREERLQVISLALAKDSQPYIMQANSTQSPSLDATGLGPARFKSVQIFRIWAAAYFRPRAQDDVVGMQLERAQQMALAQQQQQQILQMQMQLQLQQQQQQPPAPPPRVSPSEHQVRGPLTGVLGH